MFGAASMPWGRVACSFLNFGVGGAPPACGRGGMCVGRGGDPTPLGGTRIGGALTGGSVSGFENVSPAVMHGTFMLMHFQTRSFWESDCIAAGPCVW